MLNHATESSLTEESSGTSFNLDEEEKTLFLDEQTTFEDMKVVIFETSSWKVIENLLWGRRQILLLKFKGIDWLLFSLKSAENLWFSDNFRGK